MCKETKWKQRKHLRSIPSGRYHQMASSPPSSCSRKELHFAEPLMINSRVAAWNRWGWFSSHETSTFWRSAFSRLRLIFESSVRVVLR